MPDIALLKKYAAYKQIKYSSISKLLEHPKIMDFFQRRIKRLQKTLASFEQIKYFRLLDKDFTQEAGELTPTLKIKRRIINQEYGALIEDMY